MELRYKIKEIPEEGLVIDQALPAHLLKDALEGLEPDLAQCTGSVHLTLMRAQRDVLVTGRISAALALPCGSCLKPAALTVRIPVKTLFAEGDEDEKEEDDKDILDDEDVIHYDGVMVDLVPLIREQLILSLPMSVRCKERCKGLCAVCGGDKNLNDCGHTVEMGDPRLAALKSLKLQ